jgi:uncharacterized membrane protein
VKRAARQGLNTLGNLVAPPRFIAFMMLLPFGALAYHHFFAPATWITSLTMGFDLGAIVFLISVLPLSQECGAEAIRKHADANDANRALVLAITTLLTIIVMAAITGELPAAREGDIPAIIRLVGTLLLTWLFANMVYALHYAHDFYTAHPERGDDCGGLEFPGTDEPSYSDFAYFSYTLGMTFQTSDVAVTAPSMRRVVLLHTFAAFLFNIGVIAFTINALGGK